MKKSIKETIKKLKKEKGILILGHRGCRNSDVPENTLAAFQKAYEVGSDGIEIDVESTSDNQLVVTNRWFMKSKLGFFPWERDLNFIQEQGYQKGILIPTFDEVCEFIKGIPDFIFNVEIKSSSKGYCRTPKEATKQIYNFGIENQVILSSFDINTLLTVKFNHSNLDIAISSGVDIVISDNPQNMVEYRGKLFSTS